MMNRRYCLALDLKEDPQLIAEYEALPLKDSVKDKWFYENAARFFRIG